MLQLIHSYDTFISLSSKDGYPIMNFHILRQSDEDDISAPTGPELVAAQHKSTHVDNTPEFPG